MNLRILVVDDEKINRVTRTRQLNESGCVAEAHETPFTALTALDRGAWDVVITDLRMPTMDGITFHQALRAKPEFALTPFIFLTGVNNLKEVKAVCKPECDMLLQKPFPVDQLLRIFTGKFK